MSSVVIGACARTPPVVTTFPATKTSLVMRVVRTVGCDAKNWPVVASTVTPRILHTADHATLFTVDIAKIDGDWANSNIKFGFYDDGRLKGINATTEGKGEEILTAAIKLATTVATAGLSATGTRSLTDTEVETACKELKARFGDTPLSLAFDVNDDLSSQSSGKPLEPDWQSERYYNRFKPLIGETCLIFGNLLPVAEPVKLPAAKSTAYAMLGARQPAWRELSVTVGPVGECGKSAIWTGIVPVAQQGTSYKIPIPRAALFGKQEFGAAFDEAGTLTTLQYAKDSGMAGALTAAQSGLDAVQTTTAEREAELIAAQQKLIKCRTTPSEC